MTTQDPPIITTQEFNIPTEKLWEIITTPKLMRSWFFEQIQDFKAEEGFSTTFLIEHENRRFTHQCLPMELQRTPRRLNRNL